MGLGGGPGPRFVRIGGVEVRDEFRSMRKLGLGAKRFLHL